MKYHIKTHIQARRRISVQKLTRDMNVSLDLTILFFFGVVFFVSIFFHRDNNQQTKTSIKLKSEV